MVKKSDCEAEEWKQILEIVQSKRPGPIISRRSYETEPRRKTANGWTQMYER